MLKYIPAIITTLLLAGCAERAPQAKLGSPDIEPPDITRWAAPDVDLIQLLSVEPNECLPPPAQSGNLQNIALGRMAFRSPFLLGGQASRRGLTCQACHTQGARNENFFVVGLSETPGTADVSNFHFSDELGDEVFNPSPIPSLSDDIRIVDYDPNQSDFEDFVIRLITKEFTGKHPSPEIKTALLSYLRQLDDSHCTDESLSGADLLAYKVKVIDQTFVVLSQNNFTPTTQTFLSAALRVELGRLNTRFPNTETVQTELLGISQHLNSRGGDVSAAQIRQAAQQWSALAPNLASYYGESLFNPPMIAKWAQ